MEELEPIIQSEVSQKDKDQYSILTHIYGILKDGNNNSICKTEKKKTDIQNRPLDSVFFKVLSLPRMTYSKRS